MSQKRWRRLRAKTEGRNALWTPPQNWVEVAPQIYEPRGYVRSEWELATMPDCSTAEACVREYRRCQQSVAYFAFRYCWTVDEDDPERPGYKRIPALPYLRDYFTRMQPVKNTHIDKTRQMMGTWATMALFLWDVLFHDDWHDLCVSMKEQLVDNGGERSTPNCLMGKVRAMHERLPSFLFHKFDIAKNRITNVDRQSTISGETGASDPGRSGTYRRILLDEASRIPNSESAFKASSQASKHGLILLSTPDGKANVHARIRFQPNTGFQRLSYHWTQHPDKARGIYCECGWRSTDDGALPHLQFEQHTCLDTSKQRKARSPWYDNECRKLRPDQIASELDISYEESTRGRVYSAFKNAPPELGGHTIPHESFRPRIGNTPHFGDPLGPCREHENDNDYRWRYLTSALDPNLPVFTSWDFGVSDPTVMLLGQEVSPDGPVVRWLDLYRASDQSWRHFHAFWDGLWRRAWEHVGGIKIHAWAHYGDPSGKNRESDLRSWMSNLASADPPVVIDEGPKRNTGGSQLEWLDFINDQFRLNRIEISSYCTVLLDAVAQYHFPIDRETGLPISGKHEPVHDQWSHPCDAMRYTYRNRYAYHLHDTMGQGETFDAIFEIGANLTPLVARDF